jgi:glycosyltransferase involved in cell wall biosynthesis
MRSWWTTRRAVAALGRDVDVVIVHDLELVPWLPRRRGVVRVWDVHEDFVALVDDTLWIPRPVRAVARVVVKAVERIARSAYTNVLAEEAYRVRFPGCAVVPNTTWVDEDCAPPDEPARVVYIGRLSFDRGVREMIEIGERLRDAGGPRMVLVGPTDGDCRDLIESAHRDGSIEWRGVLPNPDALAVARGATAGLSLLHDVPNYAVSRPTKVMEYLAVGVPVISTPLPLAREMIEQSIAGVVTSAWTGEPLVKEAADAVLRFASNRSEREEAGRRGWSYASAEWNWNRDGRRFVELMESLVRKGC